MSAWCFGCRVWYDPDDGCYSCRGVDSLRAEVEKLHAQRDAALALCEQAVTSYGDLADVSSLVYEMVSLANAVRAALGVEQDD